MAQVFPIFCWPIDTWNLECDTMAALGKECCLFSKRFLGYLNQAQNRKIRSWNVEVTKGPIIRHNGVHGPYSGSA